MYTNVDEVLDSITRVQKYVEDIEYPMEGTIVQILDDLYADIESENYYKEIVKNEVCR